MIKIDERKLRQPLGSRGGRDPVKITMSRETRGQIGQILHIGPGGSLSAFVDWACQLLLYILGADDAPESPFAITEMLEAMARKDAKILAQMSAHSEIIALHLWATAQELSGDPNYSITREAAADMS